jgi:hypothetical protein
MFKKDNVPDKVESSVTVRVDVTKIVKYVCIAGVMVVGIIFGTKCYQKILENFLNDEEA